MNEIYESMVSKYVVALLFAFGDSSWPCNAPS